MKKRITICLVMILLLCACSQVHTIDVISREDGSGTRGAFTELLGILVEDEDGSEHDMTKDSAEVTNSTAVVMQTVAEDENAIGYMSMGSLNNSVKALAVDGISPTTEHVKDGSYPIARSFLITTKDDISPQTKDFISYILSSSGQKVVSDNGYVAVTEDVKEYSPTSLEGVVRVAGSSSVTPVMEALAQEYMKLNPDIDVEIEQSDSTTGITATSEGITDIGMSSRELKQEELDSGIKPTTIAYDGLAVVVNPHNNLETLESSQIADIFTGKILEWEELDAF